MIYKTQGIVVKNTKYGETSMISKIFTKEFGLQSYIINGVRKRKPRFSPSLLQPASLLKMVVYHKDNKNIQRVKELKAAHIYQQLPFHVIKSSLVLYVLEIFYKSIDGSLRSPHLFDFLLHAFKFFDQKKSGIANFHLLFLVKLTKHMGFYPTNNFNEDTPFFNIKKGKFYSNIPSHDKFLTTTQSRNFSVLLDSNFSSFDQIQLSLPVRKQLTKALEQYYKWHIMGPKQLNSRPIIEEILN